MKKTVLPVLLLFALFSCSKKPDLIYQSKHNITYELLRNRLFHQSDLPDADSFYFPKDFEKKLLHEDNGLYLIEQFYPELTGLIDCEGYYLEALDDGEWVDNVLNGIEEQRIGEDIMSFLENNASITVPYNMDNPEEAVSVEKRLLDSKLRLKSMEYGKEIFIPQQLGEKKIFISTDSKNFMRSFYDDFYRLIKTESWDIPDIKNAKLICSEEYSYNGKSEYPEIKVTRANDSLIKVFYKPESSLARLSEFYDKNALQKSFTWKYDDSDRLTEEVESDFSSGVTFEKKQVYIYNIDEEIPPDYEYYENGEIKLKTQYSSKNDYVTVITFDEGLSVTSYYENNKKTKDVYMQDDVIIREKKYE
ncbi:MAG: hypothetical protein IKX23_11025 [Treponema sp.]|nr:hypothetical protein [Treponema sp.]